MKERIESKLVFLDTETTGIGEGHKIIQLAYLYGGGKFVNEFIDPQRDITVGAKAIHHITEDMVKGKPTFDKSLGVARLKTLIDNGAIIVAHNASFDCGMLEAEGLKCPEYIDTLKIAEWLREWDGFDFESCSLQYLRYKFDLKFDDEIIPHDAYSDVVVLKAVYDVMIDLFGYNEGKMVRISKNPLRLKKIRFGKYQDQFFDEVYRKDVGYLQWLKKTLVEKPKNERTEKDKNLDYTLSFYLK